jgi:hypothetical protein
MQAKHSNFDVLGGWASLSTIMPHVQSLLDCLVQPPSLVPLFVIYNMTCWYTLIDNFLLMHDTFKLVGFTWTFPQPSSTDNVVTVSLNWALVSSIEHPYCLLSKAVLSSIFIDSGTSVCISPHRSGFVIYLASKMKIKGLSSSDQVAGEGILCWSLQDANGNTTYIELLGYHIPNSEVCLLSLQVLLKTIGGHALQHVKEIAIVLDNGLPFCAKHCPTSNLPLIPLALQAHSKNSFWTTMLGFTADGFCEINTIKTVVRQSNMNLSASQKELLLWHQRLSHASINWIQTLMQDRLWLPDADKGSHVLHSGPFLPTKSCAPLCDTSKLKFAVCHLYAKASTRTPNNQAAHRSPKARILKENHLMPGDCILADHYFSPAQGDLPHLFGKEHHGYSCGSLFVDHASDKIFNFLQYSNTAHKTLQSIKRLEAMAREEGFNIKSYHSDNGIFATANFKAHFERSQQTFSFSGVSAKHQNGIAERNIKTVAHWARANMLHLATHWPQCADSKFELEATDYAVWVFNRLPSLDSGIAPNELWSGVRAHGTDMTRAHVFGCPVYVLDASLRDGKKIPKWSPRHASASSVNFQTYTCLRFLWS